MRVQRSKERGTRNWLVYCVRNTCLRNKKAREKVLKRMERRLEVMGIRLKLRERRRLKLRKSYP